MANSELRMDVLEEALEYAWLNIDHTKYRDVKSPTYFSFFPKGEFTYPEVLMDTLLDPDYFYFTARTFFNVELHPFQVLILKELWTKSFPMLVAARGWGKTFLIALYAMMRAFLCQGSKVVVCGAGFRQSKLIFAYCEQIWRNSPILRDICSNKADGPHIDTDRVKFILGNSTIVGLPIGDGTKIRGERATHLLVDEFSSVPVEIYETVLVGFAAVSQDPIEAVKKAARQKLRQKLTAKSAAIHEGLISGQGNQSVLAGTGYYSFNHFAKYWQRYKDIILSRGDVRRLTDIHGGELPKDFNWKDYCIVRFPYELLPNGFMDDKQISRSRTMIHNSTYLNEYGACFSDDSDGFYKRSLIESCVTHEDKPISVSGQDIVFRPMLKGDSAKRYVYGIDPASEADNFAIVVLEVHPDHNRIVYCWTTTKKRYRTDVQEGRVADSDFYGFTARKIRNLMRDFPCERMGIDTQGGGVAVMEALHDIDKMLEGENQLWPIIDKDKEKDTDRLSGLHIIEPINFASAEWTSNANHGMKKDFEDKVLVFPMFDTLSIALAGEEDNRLNRKSDTLEECATEIEELKDELSTITYSQTSMTVRERWELPEVKLAGGKKGRLRKDRYSALLIANAVSRGIKRALPSLVYESDGTLVNGKKDEIKGRLYQGPDWYNW